MSSTPGFLVFDCESVTDGRLLQRVRYPDEPTLSPAEAVARHRTELMERTGSDFIPHTFQVPVSVVIAKVAEDYTLLDLVSLDRPRHRPQVISKQFWQGWQHYRRPTLVTFNGRGFDLPLLEMAAFRYGYTVPDWFTMDGPSYSQPRNRFNSQRHLDLQELLTNFGAARQNGGLDLLATLLGKPGKMGTKGHMVQDIWEAGGIAAIDDYCCCDVLDTYFVFLRCMLLLGRLTIEREAELVDLAHARIETWAEERVALREYLDRFQRWLPTGDEGSGMLS